MVPPTAIGLLYIFWLLNVTSAEVVDVTVIDQGIRIDDAWKAADCVLFFNPVNAEAQLAGGTILGAGYAMNGELTYENHAPV